MPSGADIKREGDRPQQGDDGPDDHRYADPVDDLVEFVVVAVAVFV